MLEKRKWVYLQQPSVFDMSGCSCGNNNTQWSEYKDHLWCDVCQKDFIPEDNGIFDGPIPVKLAAMMGISFDRFNLETEEIERFELDNEGFKI